MNKLNIAYLNVCGLKSKLLNPDFDNFIKKHDILVFVETKTDDYDEIKLPKDYTLFTKNRQKFKKKSGGIIIIYKKKLSHILKFINSESEFVQWVEILHGNFDTGKDILLGCVYIPPEFSRYSSDESFSEIEDELIRFSNTSKEVALIGDFNSRTSIDSDHVIPDESLLEILQVEDDVINKDIFSYLLLESKNIPLQRYSYDQGRVNKYGTLLLELCKRCGIFICNGRIFSDKFIGHTTCKDSSVVDYLIVSPHMFDYISEFRIDEFNPMFSDLRDIILYFFNCPSILIIHGCHSVYREKL